MKSTDTDDIKREVAKILLDIGSVIFRPKQPFRFTSGILSPVYTDNRLILSRPKERKVIINLLTKLVKKIGTPDVIAGTSTAGIPHAAFIAQKLNLPMVYARPRPKDHGRENQVEGSLRRGQRVIVIDDLISTGRSSLEAAEAVRKVGGKVTDLVAITSYGLKVAQHNFKKAKIKLHTLTDLDHSAEIAMTKGFLKKEQVNVIKNWAKDPQNWGKNTEQG